MQSEKTASFEIPTDSVVLPLLCDGGDGYRVVGSATPLDYQHFLVCWHEIDGAAHIAIGSPSNMADPVRVDQDLDLVLLKLREEPEKEHPLRSARPCVFYEGAIPTIWSTVEFWGCPNGVVEKASGGRVSQRHARDGGGTLSIQINNGVPNGFSGGPAFTRYWTIRGPQVACVGIATLGGRSAAKSRLTGAALLKDFLSSKRFESNFRRVSLFQTLLPKALLVVVLALAAGIYGHKNTKPSDPDRALCQTVLPLIRDGSYSEARQRLAEAINNDLKALVSVVSDQDFSSTVELKCTSFIAQ